MLSRMLSWLLEVKHWCNQATLPGVSIPLKAVEYVPVRRWSCSNCNAPNGRASAKVSWKSWAQDIMSSRLWTTCGEFGWKATAGSTPPLKHSHMQQNFVGPLVIPLRTLPYWVIVVCPAFCCASRVVMMMMVAQHQPSPEQVVRHLSQEVPGWAHSSCRYSLLNSHPELFSPAPLGLKVAGKIIFLFDDGYKRFLSCCFQSTTGPSMKTFTIWGS